MSFFSTVPQPGDWVVYDELVHASVHSGLRASRVDPSRKFSFGHNDPEALRAVLQRITSDGSTVFLALESLYSMDGDMSPLTQLLDLLDEHVSRRRQCVVLDEAHTTGTYGPGGRGMAFALGEAGGDVETARAGRRGIRRNRVGVRLMTFGKAVGCSGGERRDRRGSYGEHADRLSGLLHSGPSLLGAYALVPHQLCSTIHLLDSDAPLHRNRARVRMGCPPGRRGGSGQSPRLLPQLPLIPQLFHSAARSFPPL